MWHDNKPPALHRSNRTELERRTEEGGLTGSEAALLRPSTAPNADRIEELEKRVARLERDRAITARGFKSLGWWGLP